MDDKKIVEAMARLEFGKAFLRATPTCGSYLIGLKGKGDVYRDYTSHDGVQLVVDGLGNAELERYLEELGFALLRQAVAEGTLSQGKVDGMSDLVFASEVAKLIAKATPRQKVEAVLKAVGKWEDN